MLPLYDILKRMSKKCSLPATIDKGGAKNASSDTYSEKDEQKMLPTGNN
jgi:hypothetical protein